MNSFGLYDQKLRKGRLEVLWHWGLDFGYDLNDFEFKSFDKQTKVFGALEDSEVRTDPAGDVTVNTPVQIWRSGVASEGQAVLFIHPTRPRACKGSIKITTEDGTSIVDEPLSNNCYFMYS